jgi:large subunit ribosomal protein L5
MSAATETQAMTATARLQKHYREVVRPKLRTELGLKTDMQVPRITKITVNMGVGEAVADKKVMDAATADLAKITGQKPAVRKSKKSVATFKIREGLPVGCMVTLRGARMYEFLDRLINVAMPRIRDFRGVNPRSFDGQGNYSFGVKEQIIFPEIAYDQIDRCAAWTSRSPRPRATTSRDAPCSMRSISRSGSDRWRRPA